MTAMRSSLALGREAMEAPVARTINVGNTERWISMISGSILAIYGLTRESLSGKAALSAVGAYLFYRGQTGHCALYQALGVNTSKTETSAVSIDRSIIINRSPEEVYRFWHNFENLPRFMEHLESVKVFDDRRSHWTASVPGGLNFEWDAEMIEDIPNQRISWRSLENAEVQNDGAVEFRRVPGGTELKFRARYEVPGVAGGPTSALFKYLSEKQLQRELEQFKSLIEAREFAGARV